MVRRLFIAFVGISRYVEAGLGSCHVGDVLNSSYNSSLRVVNNERYDIAEAAALTCSLIDPTTYLTSYVKGDFFSSEVTYGERCGWSRRSAYELRYEKSCDDR